MIRPSKRCQAPSDLRVEKMSGRSPRSRLSTKPSGRPISPVPPAPAGTSGATRPGRRIPGPATPTAAIPPTGPGSARKGRQSAGNGANGGPQGCHPHAPQVPPRHPVQPAPGPRGLDRVFGRSGEATGDVTVLDGARLQPPSLGPLLRAPGPARGAALRLGRVRGLRGRAGRGALRPHEDRSDRRRPDGSSVFNPALSDLLSHHGAVPCVPPGNQRQGRAAVPLHPLGLPPRQELQRPRRPIRAVAGRGDQRARARHHRARRRRSVAEELPSLRPLSVERRVTRDGMVSFGVASTAFWTARAAASSRSASPPSGPAAAPTGPPSPSSSNPSPPPAAPTASTRRCASSPASPSSSSTYVELNTTGRDQQRLFQRVGR